MQARIDELRAVITAAPTRAEARELVLDALREHLLSLRDDPGPGIDRDRSRSRSPRDRFHLRHVGEAQRSTLSSAVSGTAPNAYAAAGCHP